MDLYRCEKCELITSMLFAECPNCRSGALKTILYVEEIQVPCKQCGCYENEEDLRDGMCDDCYEDYLYDLREDEE